MKRILVIFLLSFSCVACSTKPPKHPNNVCKIFQEYPAWYWTTLATRKKWGVPINVQMAIMYQESHFLAGNEPPRKKLFGVIPWFRPTSAEGYAQAVNETWRRYLKARHRRGGNRADFAMASDFIGWYVSVLHRKLDIPKSNTYEVYLAYHEGSLGYRVKSYRDKPKLMHIAWRVSHRAAEYKQQLLECESTLPKKPWWRFW